MATLAFREVFGPWLEQARVLEDFLVDPNQRNFSSATEIFAFSPGVCEVINGKLVQVIGFSHEHDPSVGKANVRGRGVATLYEDPFCFVTQLTGAIYGWFTIREGARGEYWVLCDPKVYVPYRGEGDVACHGRAYGGDYATLRDGGVCGNLVADGLAQCALREKRKV